MTPKQLSEIKAEIQDIKDMMNSADEDKRSDVGYFKHSSGHILDVEDVRKAINAREIQIRKFTPIKFTGEQANKALNNAKKIKAWIIANIPKEVFVSYPREKDPVSKTMDFERAIQAQVKWQTTKIYNNKWNGQEVIAAYHYLMRRVDPDAPKEDFNKYVRERA